MHYVETVEHLLDLFGCQNFNDNYSKRFYGNMNKKITNFNKWRINRISLDPYFTH